MNDLLSALLILSIPGLPLLLAAPALHRRLPRAPLIALFPAAGLVIVGDSNVVELPWMLLGGSGLGVDEISLWWLVISVVVWAAAATMSFSSVDGKAKPNNRMPWFLLGMAGQLGSVLAADPVGFFAFASLAGYAIFGFLVVEEDAALRRAGRAYLVLIIVSDIILFEALVVIAATTAGLEFAGLSSVLAESPDTVFALWLALIAFVLRMGLWPLHVWLRIACHSTRRAVPLVIWIGPVATGILGMVRWLPFGEPGLALAGGLLQGAGAVTVLYAVVGGLKRSRHGQGDAYLLIAASGAITLLLGIFLAEPSVGSKYISLMPLVMAGITLGLTALTSFRFRYRREHSRTPMQIADSRTLDGYERWAGSALQLTRWLGSAIFPAMRVAINDAWLNRWDKLSWQRRLDIGERWFLRWAFAVLLVLLLAMLITLGGLLLASR